METQHCPCILVLVAQVIDQAFNPTGKTPTAAAMKKS